MSSSEEDESSSEIDDVHAYKQFEAESDFEQVESETEAATSPRATLSQIKATIPLETLARASKLMTSKNKAKPSSTVAAADALPAANKKRNGRQTPRVDGTATATHNVQKKNATLKQDTTARSNKHAPMEMSSKRPVKRARTTLELGKKSARDPRFDHVAGDFSKEAFEKSYAFLHDARKEELQNLKRQVARSKKNASMSLRDKNALQAELTKMESQVAQADKDRREAQVIKEWKQKEKTKQSEHDKRPYFLKRGQKKVLLKESKLEELATDKRRLRKHQRRQSEREARRERKAMPQERPFISA